MIIYLFNAIFTILPVSYLLFKVSLPSTWAVFLSLASLLLVSVINLKHYMDSERR